MTKKVFNLILYIGCLFGYTQTPESPSSFPKKYGLDSTKCEDNNQIYYDLYKSKNYTEAYPYWKWMFDNCPLRTKNIYIHGPKIIKAVIKKNENSNRDSILIDTLLLVYDNRLIFFPGKEGFVLGKKGSDLVQYRNHQAAAAFEILKKSIALDGNKSSANTLSYYIKAAASMFNDKLLTKEEIMDIYAIVVPIIDYNILNHSNITAYENALKNIETMLGPLFSCETLLPIYSSKLNENQSNQAWLSKAYIMLRNKNCKEDPVFFDIANALFTLAPNSKIASDLGKFSLDKNQNSQAINYYKKAVDFEENDSLKSWHHLYLAQAYKNINNFSSSRSHAETAAKLKNNWGAPYLLIGDLYAASAKYCNKNELERKAIYWAAIDKYYKARQIDPEKKDAAEKRISTYSPFCPDQTLLFEFGYHDKASYTIGCWINETVKIR